MSAGFKYAHVTVLTFATPIGDPDSIVESFVRRRDASVVLSSGIELGCVL